MAPRVGLIVKKMMSEISTTPLEPAVPTWTTGTGLLIFWKAAPFPAMTDQASPTIFVPAGIWIVLVTT
jgi:hypothetical protein